MSNQISMKPLKGIPITRRNGWQLDRVTDPLGQEHYHVYSIVALAEGHFHSKDRFWFEDMDTAERYFDHMCETQDDSFHVERLGL